MGFLLCLQTLQGLQPCPSCEVGLLFFLVITFSCLLIFANICQDNKFTMATQFGERIRELRTKQKLLLRHVASKLDVDTSIISKIERGERPIKKEQIAVLAEILQADKEELLTLWLADQIIDVTKDEDLALKAMQVAEDEIKYRKTKKKNK
jgi:transcriptional regulator with XRE-family HTH domain